MVVNQSDTMTKNRILLFSTLVLTGFVGCAFVPTSEHWGHYGRRVTTSVPEAQSHFDRGLLLALGFNHDEAAREFGKASELDPDCAMAHWGVAYSVAPNINLPLTDEEVAQRGHEAAQRALAALDDETDVEKALVEAMAKRFASPPPDDRRPLDVAYADAMRDAYERFPADADVAVLFADAMLNLRPWDQWQSDGSPQPGTEELLAALERALALKPRHPGACHLYIHSVEASKNPERGLVAADTLRALNLTAVGHLVHMPSHIYIRTGRYAESAEANRLAVEADRAYFEKAGPQGIYELYKAHNHHFQMYSAMFLGDKETTLRAAREGAAEISDSVKQAMAPFADCYMPMALHGMIRFGMWEEILAEPGFESKFPIAVATYHYARGVALANLDRHDEAKREAEQFESAAAAIPDDAMVVGTPAKPVMDVARLMLRGEMLFRRGEEAAGLDALRAAIAKEDALPYDEPRGWMQPVRHALGALLLQRGEFAAAERAYRDDLAINPNNGWSLHGLAECLRGQGNLDAADRVAVEFEAAWRHADVQIAGSCYCRRHRGS